MGSPVYFLACTGGTAGAAAGCWAGLANANSFPVSQPGSGICGTLADKTDCFADFLEGRSATGMTASAGDVKEIVTSEPSVWALKVTNSARSITTRERPGLDCPKRTARTGPYSLRTVYRETARLVS